MSSEFDFQLTAYDYQLPPEFIASKASEPRDSSKLMVIERQGGKIEHRYFRDISEYFTAGDVLILNNTRVMPARLFGQKNFSGALVEVFLIRELEKDLWLCLAKPGKRLKKGTLISFAEKLTGTVQEILESGERIIKFTYPKEYQFMEIIAEIGAVPFPPYIEKPDCDPERYQTIYAKKQGSVAAPTAGLHFTNELFAKLREKGVFISQLTLHVGLGTFQPVKTENILEHKMHDEYYELSAETANLLNQQKEAGKKIFAVGTTSTRVLETVFKKFGKFSPDQGFSDIFIYPGYQFRAINHLITNFHLPASTLIMLVAAFWNRENILQAYELAKEKNYRFYSLGDAMLLI